MTHATIRRFAFARAVLGLIGGTFCAALLTGGAALAQEVVAPSNAAPERDARGIPVVSDPAVAPAGTNQTFVAPPGAQVVFDAGQSAAFMPQPSTGERPPCSRTVTDNCTQTYERGGGRRRYRGARGAEPPFCPDRNNPLCDD